MRRRQRGFTLLELLVATTIMAIAVGGILSALSTSMRNASRLSDYDRAAMFARRKMDELLVDRRLPKLLVLQGQWDPAMTNGRNMGWRARVLPWETNPESGPGAPMLERLELEIWWEDGDRRRVYNVEAFRRGVLTPGDIQAEPGASVMKRQAQAGITLMELLISVMLLSLLSVGMLFAMRVGLNAMGKTNDHVARGRRALAVERILTGQMAGFLTTTGLCSNGNAGPPTRMPFFQGEPQTMRFVSSFSLSEASRGYPRILEHQVIPGENGEGVRLIVNELLYTGPFSTGSRCTGVVPDPSGALSILWRPVVPSPQSYVLADRLARCQFSFKEELPPDQPADRWHPRWQKNSTPAAVRIDMAPLVADLARLQIPPVIAPFRVTRHPFSEYSDTN